MFVVIAVPPLRAETLKRDGIQIEYSPESAGLAEKTMATLIAGREAFRRRLPESPPTLYVVICASYRDFEKYAGPLATYSVLGVADLEHDLIALKTPSLVPPGTDYTGTIRHELIHILLRHNVNTDNMPRWLNEGVAMVLSGEDRWESRAAVASMYLNGRILTYRDLESSFLDPGNELEFGDAYAQAYSMTQYLMGELGDEGFWDLLYSLDSRTFGVALEARTGKAPYDFWLAWKGSIGWFAIAFSIVSGFTVFQLMALLTIMAYLRKRRHALRVMEQWEREDGDDVDYGGHDGTDEEE